ncbi:MAG: NAD(P)-dependent oxidoreductase [Acidimicrobiaceae bacterium]|nr:NAD(P)-dependent oxidoreductase [Acidimicrobiaceae bacterium]MYE96970.1 NAD(P)-dependent oxidoreductase [Acidimicrobiaceae bacterium]
MTASQSSPGSGGGGFRVSFLGLGTMGGPMCRRLVAAGYSVTAYDLDAAALAAAVDTGAVAAVSARDCALDADVFMTSLPGPPQVEAVMAGTGGALGAMRPGSVWVDLTTNSRELVLGLASVAPDGVAVVDSPVTGAVDGARRGELTLFVGGEPEPLAVVRPVLEHLGTVIECGPLGAGNVVKLVTNQLWFAAAAALGEGFAVGLANGVELRTLWEAVLNSVGDSFVARHDAPSIFAGHYDPSFPLALCVKDLGLLADLEASVDADLPVTAAARSAFEWAAARYGLDAGEMCVARRIADDARMSMQLEGDWTPHWER